MKKNWIVRIYDAMDTPPYDQSSHIVVRDSTEEEAKAEVRGDVFEVGDWNMSEITPREELWLKVLEALTDALHESYNGHIEDYTVLDHGWDSLDALELIMLVEGKLYAQISDDILEGLKFDDSTPAKVAHDFIARLSDRQVEVWLGRIRDGVQVNDIELFPEKPACVDPQAPPVVP